VVIFFGGLRESISNSAEEEPNVIWFGLKNCG
jgi:hypothetical protein